jgi:hypothetical protein
MNILSSVVLVELSSLSLLYCTMAIDSILFYYIQYQSSQTQDRCRSPRLRMLCPTKIGARLARFITRSPAIRNDFDRFPSLPASWELQNQRPAAWRVVLKA